MFGEAYQVLLCAVITGNITVGFLEVVIILNKLIHEWWLLTH